MRTITRFVLLLSLLSLSACSTVGHSVAGINNFDQVSPNLYRGAQPTAEGIQTLTAYHVKTIINLRDDLNPQEAALAKAAGIHYVALPQDASNATPADAANFLALLDTVPQPIFVHCHAGRDRTGLVVAAYRLRIQQWTLQNALHDLYNHGQHWVLFPKIPQALAAFAKIRTPPIALAQAPAKN